MVWYIYVIGSGKPDRLVFGIITIECLPERGMLPPEQPLSPDEWRNLKESAGNPPQFEFEMMTNVFRAGIQLDVAK